MERLIVVLAIIAIIVLGWMVECRPRQVLAPPAATPYIEIDPEPFISELP